MADRFEPLIDFESIICTPGARVFAVAPSGEGIDMWLWEPKSEDGRIVPGEKPQHFSLLIEVDYISIRLGESGISIHCEVVYNKEG